MRALIVYESMYGNTHLIADAIAAGLDTTADVTVVPVHEAAGALGDGADLLVVGAPTHVHGLPRPSTRKAAVEAAEKPDSRLTPEPGAETDGVREWLDTLDGLEVHAAAFDTRLDAPTPITGSAAKKIAKQLRHHGCTLIDEPHSFLVTKSTELEPDQHDKAREWGASLGRAISR
jgi:hypothetical protein